MCKHDATAKSCTLGSERFTCPAPPPPPPASLPPRGVKVLSGKTWGTTALTCVTDPGQTTVGSGAYATIAAQCCEADGTCRRFKGSNNDEGCIAGHSKTGTVVATTFAEAHAMCIAKGLQLCSKSCRGTGCHYNRHPVWTDLECDAAQGAGMTGSALVYNKGEEYGVEYDYDSLQEVKEASDSEGGKPSAALPSGALAAIAVGGGLLLLGVVFVALRKVCSRKTGLKEEAPASDNATTVQITSLPAPPAPAAEAQDGAGSLSGGHV